VNGADHMVAQGARGVCIGGCIMGWFLPPLTVVPPGLVPEGFRCDYQVRKIDSMTCVSVCPGHGALVIAGAKDSPSQSSGPCLLQPAMRNQWKTTSL
jgi:hypothetical protein